MFQQDRHICAIGGAPYWMTALFNMVLAALFFGYHLAIDRWYCLTADDYAGIEYASKGLPGIGYAWQYYMHWEGPFLSFFVQGLLMRLVWLGMPPVVIFIVSKIAFCASSLVLLTAISKRFELNFPLPVRVLFALIFGTTLYIISPNQPEIWHWLIGSEYLTFLIYLQMGAAALISNRPILAILPLAFVMQSRATYAVLTFGVVFLTSVWCFVTKAERLRQWVWLTAFLLAFLVIYLVAPGNYVRLEDHGRSLPDLFNQFQMGLQNLFVSYNIAKIDIVLLGLLAFLPLIGPSAVVPRPRKIWQWAIPVMIYIGFAVAHEMLFVYITGYSEWTRVLSLHSFLFLAASFIYGFWLLGLVGQQWRNRLWPLSIIGVIGLSFHLFNGFGTELEKAKELKVSYGKQMETIFAHTERGDTLYIKPLNYSGILYFEDFSENPDYWINHDFTRAYGLDFKVASDRTVIND